MASSNLITVITTVVYTTKVGRICDAQNYFRKKMGRNSLVCGKVRGLDASKPYQSIIYKTAGGI